VPPETGPTPETLRTGEWVVIARLTRTRGNRGELAATSMSGREERFADLGVVTLFGAEGFPDSPQRRAVERVWRHGVRLVFKFEGADSISEA